MRKLAGTVVLVVAALSVTACALPAQPSRTEGQVVASPLVVPTESPAPGEADAMRFRREFGLRADTAYVRRVAADPSASRADFGLPLLPAERSALLARTRASADARDVIRMYGAAYPDEFGGFYTNVDTGEVVALFTSRLPDHRAALEQLVRPGLSFEVREAKFTLAHLDAVLARISQEPDVLRSIGTRFTGAEVDVAANVVHLWIADDDPGLPELIRRQFDVGDELLVSASSDPVAALPRGSISGQVVDDLGAPVREAGLIVEAIGSIARTEPDGGVGYATRADGSFTLPRVAAMTWTIRIHPADPRLSDRVLGTATVDVAGGENAEIVVRVTRP